MSAFISRSDFEHAEVEIAPVDEGPHAFGMDQLPGRAPVMARALIQA